MYKHKLALVLMVISVSLALSGVGNVHSVRSADLPLAPSVQGNSDIELDEKLMQFERYLTDMQHELAIPGMSVAIVKDQELVWAQGFGYADVVAKRPATADT